MIPKWHFCLFTIRHSLPWDQTTRIFHGNVCQFSILCGLLHYQWTTSNSVRFDLSASSDILRNVPILNEQTAERFMEFKLRWNFSMTWSVFISRSKSEHGNFAFFQSEFHSWNTLSFHHRFYSWFLDTTDLYSRMILIQLICITVMLACPTFQLELSSIQSVLTISGCFTENIFFISICWKMLNSP